VKAVIERGVRRERTELDRKGKKGDAAGGKEIMGGDI
jgi:hypothetical protein